jgi:hypothetical protein
MFSRETTWTNAAKMGPEEWYEMYVRPFHPELALVGMRLGDASTGAGHLCLVLRKELVCPWAHSLGSAHQACASYD